jgi:uncharacterized SAM-binding protein YcdF (DUF218 family)
VFLKSLLVSLLIPPFGFVTLAAFTMLLPGINRRFRQILIGTSIVGLILLAMPAIADRMLDALETGIPAPPPGSPPPAAIIVLSAEVRRTSDVPSIVVGRLTLERLATAVRLQRRTNLPVLLSGGSLQADLPPMADVMAESMQNDFRVPVRWRETKSQTTWENAAFSADILKKEGITSVYVVTHAWHMRRALLAFRGTGLTVTPAPIPPDRRIGIGLERQLFRVTRMDRQCVVCAPLTPWLSRLQTCCRSKRTPVSPRRTRCFRPECGGARCCQMRCRQMPNRGSCSAGRMGEPACSRCWARTVSPPRILVCMCP